jgi:hypothetical protein
MGVETGIGAILSAVGTAAATAVVGAAASQALAPKPQKQAAPTAPDAPPKAQATQDPMAIAKKNALAASAAGSMSGNNSTLLTGSQGINPANLNLGQSVLLGE